MVRNQQFANAQWAFQSGKSTATAFLATTHEWFQMLDSGKDVCAVFFDIQQVFDTILYHTLMQKLQHAGLKKNNISYTGSVAT